MASWLGQRQERTKDENKNKDKDETRREVQDEKTVLVRPVMKQEKEMN